ncbi:hypothetical protein EWB00_005966 [Schistosoma japonicum]|uniref:Uncharacterized protein n=1 Tax=Schistosoma japonicum TaxID=6182 RepID=A0A4Z2DU66_SCHJA|nr:hypothetical protein EWB00_005966 [Schistosoma japonicum]
MMHRSVNINWSQIYVDNIDCTKISDLMITLPVDALKVLGLLVIFHYKVGSRYSIQMKRLTSPLCSTKTQSDSYYIT